MPEFNSLVYNKLILIEKAPILLILFRLFKLLSYSDGTSTFGYYAHEYNITIIQTWDINYFDTNTGLYLHKNGGRFFTGTTVFSRLVTLYQTENLLITDQRLSVKLTLYKYFTQ